jgi:hypothetical protein
LSGARDALATALAFAALAAIAGGVGLAARGGFEPVAPRPAAVERCNAEAARRAVTPILRHGGLGAAACAGIGSSEPELDPRAAARSAALGALLGTTAHALEGIRDEHRGSLDARVAYRECLARSNR